MRSFFFYIVHKISTDLHNNCLRRQCDLYLSKAVRDRVQCLSKYVKDDRGPHFVALTYINFKILNVTSS